MSKSPAAKIEMRVGMNGTHAFMVFSPPLKDKQKAAMDPQYSFEAEHEVELNKKRHHVFVFPRGGFGWNNDERETVFVEASRELAGRIGDTALTTVLMDVPSKAVEAVTELVNATPELLLPAEDAAAVTPDHALVAV